MIIDTKLKFWYDFYKVAIYQKTLHPPRPLLLQFKKNIDADSVA